MRSLGERVRTPARVYFTGGVTAVIFGWRESTIDVDMRFSPELDELYRALPELKEKLSINIELASPPDFIPAVPGWEDRCIYIRREGKLDFYHFDPYSQALAKIERGHAQDKSDVESMFREGLITSHKLLELFDQRSNLDCFVIRQLSLIGLRPKLGMRWMKLLDNRLRCHNYPKAA